MTLKKFKLLTVLYTPERHFVQQISSLLKNERYIRSINNRKNFIK